MEKYISNFEITSELTAFSGTSDCLKPHVSLTRNNMKVYYFGGPYNSHSFVDLGLPSGTKWAMMNVGATSETEYGNYYQYGKGADDYAITYGQSNYSGTENPLATSADTAAQVMGGEWHIPTRTQLQELIANTTYSWEIDFNGSGINGGKFTAQNGNYIFIPAAGYINGSYYEYVTRDAFIWSSTPGDTAGFSYIMDCSSDDYREVYVDFYQNGYSIRGVVG